MTRKMIAMMFSKQMRDNGNQVVLKNSLGRGDEKAQEGGKAVPKSWAACRHARRTRGMVESRSTGVRPTGSEFQFSTQWLPQPWTIPLTALCLSSPSYKIGYYGYSREK